MYGAVGGVGGGAAGDPESRRGVRATGSAVPARAAGVHGQGCRGGGVGDRVAVCRAGGTGGRLCAATAEQFDFSEQDVWTLFHSYGFDFSVWEMWGALLHGGRLVVVPYWVSRSPEGMLELLRQQRVSVLNQTPSAFRQLQEAEAAAGGEGAELAL